ncbi:MAG: hypothetical protein K2Q24_01960 [Chitinophagaceae bacterium]|jgi:hypothetical protein|nr:hypothetical protein [Chitinophagaceae bacterium]
MKWQKKHSSLIVIAIGFGILYFFFRKEWMLTPIVLCFIGFLIEPVGNFTHIIWMQLAKMLGYINSRILLFIIFFIILTPIAFLRKLFGKKTIQDKNKITSYFQNRIQQYKAVDLQNPW